MSGFLISWATPAVSWPSEASFCSATICSCACSRWGGEGPGDEPQGQPPRAHGRVPDTRPEHRPGAWISPLLDHRNDKILTVLLPLQGHRLPSRRKVRYLTRAGYIPHELFP